MRRTIELNPECQRALNLMNDTKEHVFVTGKAGTGKSTLLKYFRVKTQKNVAFLAPTGVAAINIQGQTIHSFFKFKPNVTPDSAGTPSKRRTKKKLYRELDAIVIDEISMVRADLLDCVDAFLRLNGPDETMPFGGVQMIFIGDLYQLPPVVPRDEKELFEDWYKSPYFFDSHALADLDLITLELIKVYRQKDHDFIQLLNSVRNRTISNADLKHLNSRYQPNFTPKDDDFTIYLTATNALSAERNESKLDELTTESFEYTGEESGDFEQKSMPASKHLQVKVGAQVMLVNNDREGRWVNGTIGKILEIKSAPAHKDKPLVVELENGNEVEVLPHTWDMFKFIYNDKGGKLEFESIGSYTQYPLILAWAVTIHKSQGKTFDHVVIDLGRGAFAHGQVYVALSRCTTFEGLVLQKPIQRRDIRTDSRIMDFLAHHEVNTN